MIRARVLSWLRCWLLFVGIVALSLIALVGVAAAQGGQTHTVLAGETLGGIAGQYGVSVQALMAANGLVNPNLIYAGQGLLIPGGTGGTTSASAPAPTGGTYTVQRGDTLTRIARQYNLTAQTLMTVNGIANPDLIYVGQTLIIPGGSGGGGSEFGIGGPLQEVQNVPATATTPFAYLDRAATQRVGQIPRGTPLWAIGRSSVRGSNMMLVDGQGFRVWVGWPWTTLTEAQYRSLGVLDHVNYGGTFCRATWCYAPSSPPLFNPITGPQITGAPIVAAPGTGFIAAPGVAAPGGALQHLDNAHVRILFNEDNVGEGWAEFRLELCGTADATHDCEPVLRLYEGGQPVGPVRVENGYPVYRLSYHLHSTARLESSQYYAEQLWVSHPYDDRSD